MITDQFPYVDPLFYEAPDSQMLAYGYLKLRDRALAMESALEYIAHAQLPARHLEDYAKKTLNQD